MVSLFDDKVVVSALASSIAAITSVLGVIINFLLTRSNDGRKAHREIFYEFLIDLGSELHQIMACTDIIYKRNKLGKDVKEWRDKVKISKDKIEQLRRKTRYILYGVDSGLRDVTRVADWIEHSKVTSDKTQKKLLKSCDNLRKALDKAILYTWKNGRSPNYFHMANVALKRQIMRRTYKKAKIEDVCECEKTSHTHRP